MIITSHLAGQIEIRAQSIHLLLQALARFESSHAESAGQLERRGRVVAEERIVALAEPATPRDVRPVLNIQRDVRRHRRIIRAVVLRHDRADRRIQLAFLVFPRRSAPDILDGLHALLPQDTRSL